MRDHRRFLDILKRADEDRAGLRLVDDQTNPFELDFPTVAPIADNDDLWDIEVPVEEVEMEEVSIEDKSLDQVVADLVLDEEEAIEGYENAEEVVAASEEISEDEKDEILDVLDHIKEEEEEHIDELTELVGEEETEANSEDDTDVDDAEDEESEDVEDSEDSVEDELEEDLKVAESGESSNYVFIDLSGSSYALKDELTAAAIADGHNKDEIVYFEDSGFADATKAAEQGDNVFLYTKDDDYKVNSGLEKFPNVKIKLIQPQENNTETENN